MAKPHLSQTMLPWLLVFGLLQAGCIAISPDLDMIRAARGHRFDRVSTGGFQHEGRLQEILRQGVVEAGIGAAVAEDASLRIEGRILHADASTGGGQIAWNVINTVTLLFLLGCPYVGSADATAELRVYDGERLIATHAATATADWRAHYEVLPRVIDSRKRALRRAQELAVWRATEELAATDWR